MKKFNFLSNLLRKKFAMSGMSGMRGMNGLRADAVNPDSQPTVNRQSRLTSVQRHDSVTSARVAREWLTSSTLYIGYSKGIRYAAILLAVFSMSIGNAWGAAATLPVDYTFTTKSALPTGVTGSGLGSDYAASNAPYRLKFDGNGDYIQIEVDAAAEAITIGIKQYATTGPTFQIKGCATADGTYDLINSKAFSVGQNKTGTYTTTATIASTYRYFRIIKSAGGNGSVGTLQITKAAATCSTKPTVGSSLSSVSATANSITATVPISAIGGCDITENGLVYSTTVATPTVGAANCTTETTTACGGTAANKTVTISGLTCGQSYYVRGYATNAAGTSYTNVTTQSTSACPKYTITYNAGTGSCATSTWTQTSVGESTTLPSASSSAGCSVDDWSFAGWCISSAGSADDNTTKPGTILTSGSSYTPTSNVTLYAVYKKTVSGTTSYTLVSDAASFEDGTYVVAGLASSTYYFMDGNATSDGLGVETTGLAVASVSEGSFAATSLPSGAIEIEVEDDGDPDGDDHYYFISYTDGDDTYYMDDSGTKQSLTWTTNTTVWTYHPNFTQNAGTDGCVLLSGSGAKVSQNSSTKTSFIRNYASSGSFYNDMYFFKKSSGTTYYMTSLVCSSALGSINGSVNLTSSTDGTVTISDWTYAAGSTGTTETNVSSYTVKLYKYNSGTSTWALANANTTTGGSSGAQATRTGIATNSKSVTYTGLEYGETYKFTVQPIGDGSTYASGTETAVTSINGNSLTDNKFLNKYSIYIDDGTNDNYAHNYISSISSHAGSVDIMLNANTDYYQYKLTLGGVIWWGNTGKMTSGNCTSWTFTKDAANCKLQTSMGGTYRFALAAGTPAISVTYPNDDQAAGYKIYFDNSVLNWSNLYYRIGNTGKNQNSALTLVTGTDKFYYVTTPKFDDITAWHIANNVSWSGSNSIYLTKTNDSYAITNAIAFQQYVVTGDLTIIPTSTHSTGGDSQNNNCEFYTINTPTSGMLTHTATITAPTNGTITLGYTDVSGTSQSKTATTSGLAHRTNIVITSTPATGYNRSTLTVNGSNFTSGNTHVLSADATIAATFSAKTYSITLDREGASTGSTSVTMTYNSSSHTAITAPTKDNYEFAGWWSGDDGTGSMVMDASGVLQANVDGYTGADGIWTKDATCTLYAKWTPIKTFVPVTSSTTLEEDDEIIFNYGDYFMSTTQNANNRDRTSTGYTKSGSNYLIPSGSSVQIAKLEATDTDGNWLFNVGTDAYLYAASSSSNHLKTASLKTVEDNGVWTISVDGSNNATIQAQGTNTRNYLKYNTNSPYVFSCYASGTTNTYDTKLYYYRRTDPYITVDPSSFETFTYAVGYGPSVAQALRIKGYNLTGSLTIACPSGYELSSTSAGSGFGTSNITLTKDAKNKVNTTVYIRLAAGKSAGSYNQTMTISGGGITSTNISLTGSVVAVPASSTAYCLVTDEDDIFPDDEIVIMSSSGDRLLGAQAKNNRMATTPGNGDHFALLGPAVFTKNASDSIQNIVVEGCDDAWMFKVGDNSYLYSAGASSNNYLKSAALATAGDNGRWKIQVNTNLDDTIRSIGSAERNTMWYNASNNIFSSYATIQTELPRIYAKPSATANVCGSPLALSGFETTYGTASSAQTISVKARNISTGNVTVAAPSGYEVCMTANGTYTSSVTITPTAGAVSATTVYVRLSASSNKGTYNADSLTISATDATTRKIALSGEISCADPGLATSDDTWDVELSGSSVVISNVVSSTSSSGTITATFDPSGDTDGLVYNQAANTFTMTKTGIWEITLTQAANGNYCEDAVTCMVSVTCGTPTAPTGLEASEISYNQATISWDAVDGADHYDVIVSGKTSGGDESYMESYENITSTSTTVTGLKGGCTYEYYVSVTNTCEETNESDIEEFTTQYYVAYHSATEDDYVISIASGGSVAARGTDDCDNGKVFVGWTTSAVAALQQSDPTTNTTGAIASVTANTDLYAVFASQNGYTTATILDEKWGVVDWDGTNKIVGGSYSSWATNFADAPSTSFKISSTEYKAIVFDVSSARTIISESAYSNLKEVRITGSNRSSFAMNVTVKVSADKSAWTAVDTKSLGTASNSSPQTLVFTLDTKGNYYVRIETEAKSSGNKTGITNIRLYQEQDYYLTDYSTNCTKASSPAAITWENGGGSLADGTQPTSATIGSDITMPTLTKADYRFDGWKATINSVAKAEVFTGGDKFTVNHPVTFTAQWTQVFSVTSPTEKLTSYKDVKVTSTTQTFSTVGMHNAVPSVTVTDDTRFTMTINSHEANGGNEDYSYTFSYQPNAFGTGSGAATNTTTATITDARTGVVSSAITLSGRSLPEEFVIAVKKGDQWVALPNNLASTSAQPSIVPQVITVDNTTTPTAAVYAPSTTVYKATGRNNAAKYVRGIRFTTTGSNWLQTAKADGTYNMWLSESNSDSAQVWYLSSSDYGAYTLKMDTKHNGSKKMGIYTGGYMGFHGDPSSSDIYLLPITNKYTEIPATVHEWGVHGVVVQPSTPADLTGVTSASMHIDGASPSDATATAVNVAMGTAKYVRVYAAGATVGAVANEGKQLYVHWKNGESEVGASQIEIPYVVAESNNMATLSASKTTWPNREVHVLPGVTLTANTGSYSPKDATIKELHIYPGATVDVTTGTLIATTLRLHNGWTRADEKQYNVARVHIADDAALQKTTASMDYDIYEKSDGKHYYPLAVPFRTLVSTINYADAALASAATYGKHFGIDKYDGANRAENGATDENWVQMTTSEYLEPGKGYTITAVSSKGSAIIRVPLDFANTWTADGEKATIDESYYKNQVAVTAYTGTASTGGGENNRNAGWNILGVPYMSCFDASDASASPSDAFTKGKLNFITGEYTETNNVYVNVPVHDFSEYIQKPVSEAKLLPGWCFFVQFGKNGTLSFAVDGQEQSSSLPIYAPKRDEMQEVKTGIILSNGDKSDQTTLLISDKYSADEYEINADLEKMFGNGYTLATYSLSRNTRLAYNAMSTTDAKNVIPIGFRAPEDGEYTFSLNPRYAEAAVERVDLIDYQTGEVTNLMMSDYTFKTGRTQDDERFALNVVSMANMPTGVEENSQKSKVESRKLIIDDHVYIIRNGLMYDATGKRVDVINK